MKGLRQIRERRGLTLQQIEDLTGIAGNTISRYERGVISPNSDTAQKIAQALGVTVDELLNGPAKQELDVKIIMGVKSLTGAAIEITDNSFMYGVDDDKPQITLSGKVRIDTPEDRMKAFEKLAFNFWKACEMYDSRDKAEKAVTDIVREAIKNIARFLEHQESEGA